MELGHPTSLSHSTPHFDRGQTHRTQTARSQICHSSELREPEICGEGNRTVLVQTISLLAASSSLYSSLHIWLTGRTSIATKGLPCLSNLR